jgi:hypothetical protein
MGKIVWIASYPKSGNTWTRAFLHNLFAGGDGAYDINKMDKLSSNEAATANFVRFEERPWQEWTPAQVAALRPRVQAWIASTQPGNLFSKTHLAVMQAHGHPTINLSVTAGAIYLVRNPLDVVPSFADHQGLPIDKAIEVLNLDNHEPPTTHTTVAEPMGNWSQHVESWTARPNPGLHVMRYEDMLADPQTAFGGLVKFLGIPVTRQALRKAIKNASFKELRRQEERSGFWEKTKIQKSFFREGRAGGWRDVLSSQQVARVVEKHHAQMARFGYLPEEG